MYLLIFFLVFFSIVFVLRSYLLWKKTGVNPLTFKNGDDAHGFIGKVYTFISLLELIIVSIHAFAPQWKQYLLPFWYLEYDFLYYAGWCLLILSLVFIWFAQSSMRDSWRIGIDEANKTELVTSGFFAFSRNPIFLGIMIANIGLFMVLPNAFTLLIITLSIVSMNTQVRMEEEYLERNHGKNYVEYRSKVRRWL